MPKRKGAILSKNLIRDQALAIIDEDGLGALTMRRLATRLGVQAASLYTHFPNKEAVLESIADRLSRRIDPTGFGGSWQDGLRTWANSYYAALHWHPNAATVVATVARDRADFLDIVERVHDGLRDHGWPAREATLAAAAVEFLVLGAATRASGDSLNDDEHPGTGIEQFAESLERASFTLALDSLVRGLESVYESLRHVGV